MGLLALALLPVAGRLMEASDRRERRDSFQAEWVFHSSAVGLFVASAVLGVIALVGILCANVAKGAL